MNWTPEKTNALLQAIQDYKPVGIDKHFHMMFVLERFCAKTGQTDISADDIWKQLSQFYNLEQLDQMQPLPLPLRENVDFSLPGDLR